MESGSNDINTLGIIREWNFESSVDFWPDPYCNMINGKPIRHCLSNLVCNQIYLIIK